MGDLWDCVSFATGSWVVQRSAVASRNFGIRLDGPVAACRPWPGLPTSSDSLSFLRPPFVSMVIGGQLLALRFPDHFDDASGSRGISPGRRWGTNSQAFFCRRDRPAGRRLADRVSSGADHL